MKIFLCIHKDVSYQKIVDRIGGEHEVSPNLKTLELFKESMAATIPDVLIVDRSIEFYSNLMNLKDSVPILEFNGSFSVVIDQLSDILVSPSTPRYEEIPIVHQEETSVEREHAEEEPITKDGSMPFFDKSKKKNSDPKTNLSGHPENAEQEPSIQKEQTKETEPVVSDSPIESDLHEEIAATFEEPEENAKTQEVQETVRTDWFGKATITPRFRKNQYLNQIIGIWGAAGGIGKTEIAKNFALHLGKNLKVALLDLNLVNPDIGDQLGMGFPAGKTLYDAYSAYLNKDLSIGTLEKIMVDYHGIKVLPGLPDAVTQSDLSELFFITLVKTVRTVFDIVILDMDNDLTAAAGVQVLTYCNRIVVPLTTSSSVLGHTKVYMNLLKQGNIPMERIDFIINRYGEGGEVNEQKVFEVLGKKPLGTLPYDKKHLVSVDHGKPLYLTGHRNMVKLCEILGKPYLEAAKEIHPTETPKKKTSFSFRGFLSFGKGGAK